MTDVQIYSVGSKEVSRIAPLLTEEAAELIGAGEAFALCVAEDDEVRGAIAARFLPENEQVLEILSFYVVEQHRKKGLGGTLLMELLENTMEATGGFLTFAVASFSPSQKEMESLFQRAGFEMEETQEKTFRIPLSELKNSSLMKHTASSTDSVVPMEELTPIQVNKLYNILEKNNVNYLSRSEIQKVHPKASYVIFDQKQNPKACSLIDVQDEKDIGLVQFFTAEKTPASALAVLKATAKALLKLYPEDAILEIPVLTDSSERLVHKLLGDDLQSESMIQAVLPLS